MDPNAELRAAVRGTMSSLWQVWEAVLGDTSASARSFANLLLVQAHQLLDVAEEMDAEDGIMPPVEPHTAKMIALRVLVREADADAVKSGLMQFMPGQENTPYCHHRAVMWAMEKRLPDEREAAELEKFLRGDDYSL